MFGRATITLGIGPHSSYLIFDVVLSTVVGKLTRRMDSVFDGGLRKR